MDGIIDKDSLANTELNFDLSSPMTCSEASPEVSVSSDISDYECSEQSVEDSEGGASYSPIMKPRSFYGSSGSTLMDIKEKRKKLLISKREASNESSQMTLLKRQKTDTLEVVNRKAKPNFKLSARQFTKISGRKKNMKQKFSLKVITSINARNYSSKHVAEIDRKVNGVFCTGNITDEIVGKASETSINDRTNPDTESIDISVNSDIKILVNKICEKYEDKDKLFEMNGTNDVKNHPQLTSSIKVAENDRSDNHLLLDSKIRSDSDLISKQINSPESNNSMSMSPIDEKDNGDEMDNDKMCFNGDRIDDSEEDDDSENEFDSSLCSFIDAARKTNRDLNDNIYSENKETSNKEWKKENLTRGCHASADRSEEKCSKYIHPDTFDSLNSASSKEENKSRHENSKLFINSNERQINENKDDSVKTESLNCTKNGNRIVKTKNSDKSSSKSGLLRYFQPASNKSHSKLDMSNKVENIFNENVAEMDKASSSRTVKKQTQQLLYQSPSSSLEMKIGELTSLDSAKHLVLNSKSSSSGNPQRKSKVGKRSPANKDKKLEQLYIDVGQKNFGHTSCPTCGMLYTKTLQEDALQHAKHHEKMFQKLKFKGWKNERVLQEFHDGRIIQVNPEDSMLHLKKVSDLREVVDGELGFAYRSLELINKEKVFMFISNKRIVGCAIAVSIKEAYPVITAMDASTPEKSQDCPSLSWCCSSESVPALCGISRIWVLKQERNKSIATRLIDAVRNNFMFGVVISKDRLAFSDPTQDGKIFAEKYSGTPKILVFR